MTVERCQRISRGELRQFELFQDDDDAALQWLSERFEVACFEAGELVAKEGEPAQWLAFIMEGELQYSRPNDPSFGTISVHAGEATGVMPFSRMKTFKGRACAVKFTRIARMDVAHLRELVYRAPNLAQKLVSMMTDRTREFTLMAERNSKMLALGKLSAGLAHELNNPASAVVRSSSKLREMLLARRKDAVGLRSQLLPDAVTKTMEDLAKVTNAAASQSLTLDELERSDLEEELSSWLEKHGLDPQRAPDLVCAGLDAPHLEPLTKIYDVKTLDRILNLLLTDHKMLALISEIEEASRRMSQLVQDIKTYSFMDSAPIDMIDVAEGIRATLRIFHHQLKHGFTVKKSFAGNLPRIMANGNELNQIWTNLIDNAIDAMEHLPPEQRILEIRTVDEPDNILIEVIDSGKGIPADVQGRIFEPFFTTKAVGQGTGLGLDIVHRIVQYHKGSINVESKPGHTCFRVRLPKPPVDN